MKQDITTKVKIGMNKQEEVTKETQSWLQRVHRLSQHEDLKKLIVREYEIAEKVVKIMEKEDLKKLLKKDSEIKRVVMEVVEKNLVEKDDNIEDYKMAHEVVGDVMKDISEDFKRLMISDMKVAMVVIKLLEHEDLKKISEGDSEIANTLMKARKILDDENLWGFYKDESDVREMLKPLQNLTKNENFLKIVQDNAKLGVQVISGLSKESNELTNETVKAYKEDGCYCFAMPFQDYLHRYDISKLCEQLAKNVEVLISERPNDIVTQPRRKEDMKIVLKESMKGLAWVIPSGLMHHISYSYSTIRKFCLWN